MKKNVFITGASRGIGYETALAFANKGFDIGFSYVKNDEKADILGEKLSEIGVNSYKFKADASNYKAMEEVIDDYMSKVKKIDVLVCNAGISTEVRHIFPARSIPDTGSRPDGRDGTMP